MICMDNIVNRWDALEKKAEGKMERGNNLIAGKNEKKNRFCLPLKSLGLRLPYTYDPLQPYSCRIERS